LFEQNLSYNSLHMEYLSSPQRCYPQRLCNVLSNIVTTTITPQPFYGSFFRDHPGEPVPEKNFWTLWCKGRLTEADTLTIRLGATPSGLTSTHLHHPPYSTSSMLIKISE